jgi:pyruvate/2-oxoglutarate dehydrogenase complex dihydrolipoamide acyltransferase (E2) component
LTAKLTANADVVVIPAGLLVILTAKQSAHGLSRAGVHGSSDVGVQVQRDVDLAVAEQLAHHLRVDTLAEQQRRATVAGTLADAASNLSPQRSFNVEGPARCRRAIAERLEDRRKRLSDR